jgi:hypothetical protein
MSGQIPAGDVAGGEGKREGEYEGTLGYLVVVLEGVKAVGGGLPAEGRTGDRWRTAAGDFRWAKEGRAGPESCSGARERSRCGRFGEGKNGGGGSTATRAHGGGNGGAAVFCSRAKGLGHPFYRQGGGEG